MSRVQRLSSGLFAALLIAALLAGCGGGGGGAADAAAAADSGGGGGPDAADSGGAGGADAAVEDGAGGAPDSGEPGVDLPPGAETLEGLVETETFRVAAGETVYVTGDLVVRASVGIEVAGTLEAAGDGGQRIELEADGALVVDGVVRAGHGGAEQAGGSVVLTSLAGDVRLGGAARVEAGDGGAGAIDAERDTTGAGARGGDVVVRAPEGTFHVADGAVLRVGNGGAGADIVLRPEDRPADIPVMVLQNAGGDSGVLELQAPAVEGIETETRVAEADIVGPDGEPLIRAGEEYSVITATDHFEGGAGGAPGAFLYGADVEGPSRFSRAALSGPAEKSHEPNHYEVDVVGADGGDGFFDPDDGQSLQVRGGAGETPGADGESVRLRGGGGGQCSPGSALLGYTFGTCVAGNGGDVHATGGAGADGEAGGQNGGRGGNAVAEGGTAGIFGGAARCGNATAIGGAGGRGGGDCDVPESLANAGGTGGAGGRAQSFRGITCAPGSAVLTATGGDGGDGGDGTQLDGFGGPGGEGEADYDEDPSNDGAAGDRGQRCGVAPPPRTFPVNEGVEGMQFLPDYVGTGRPAIAVAGSTGAMVYFWEDGAPAGEVTVAPISLFDIVVVPEGTDPETPEWRFLMNGVSGIVQTWYYGGADPGFGMLAMSPDVRAPDLAVVPGNDPEGGSDPAGVSVAKLSYIEGWPYDAETRRLTVPDSYGVARGDVSTTETVNFVAAQFSGFGPDDRVVFVTDGAPGVLYHANPDRSGGAATVTPVGDAVDSPRDLHCLGGACVVSGFDDTRVMALAWSDPLVPPVIGDSAEVGAGSVGTDVRLDAEGNLVVVGTNYDADTWWFAAFSPAAELVDVQTDLPLPEGCDAPGHAIWVPAAFWEGAQPDALVSCNGSAQIVRITAP